MLITCYWTRKKAPNIIIIIIMLASGYLFNFFVDDHSDTEKTTPDISSPIQSEPDPEISETTEPSTSKKSTPMSVSSQKGLDPVIFLIENQHSTDVQKLAMLKDADKISKVYPKKEGDDICHLVNPSFYG